jgi:hypothetical protein
MVRLVVHIVTTILQDALAVYLTVSWKKVTLVQGYKGTGVLNLRQYYAVCTGTIRTFWYHLLLQPVNN